MHHFLSLLSVFIGLQVSVQYTGRCSERRVSRDCTSELTVPNGMKWGSWGYIDICPNGTYAAGFSLKVDEPSYGDNKGLTGIRLHCISLSNVLKGSFEDYTSVQSEVASWREWTDIKWCPCGFLTAFQLRVESSQLFGDDTAANNIMFRCTQEYLYGDGTLWGKWGDWSQMCRGKGICGIKTRIEKPQGSGDDTALNDVLMFCCD
ncbi:vitelline membrane outer layer protein 1-like [Carassius carassius]|uniref:vitelline membrane outer layer protein 1-like n=1 Tax=Carassius carassius TaxID=217509 RepID=UPI0028687818|nr:vitelline membrane outer layer protein 1-like [Carassius carassius]